MSQSPTAPPPGGVIHDLGYRRYDGSRDGPGRIALTLFLAGLAHAFGLKRSARSKVLPFLLLALNLIPVVVLVGIAVFIGLDEAPVSHARYATLTQVLVSIFAAAQAPVLFSRDLRHGSIVLYLARPLGVIPFALVRWASLTVAIWLFLLVPVLLLSAGGLLAGFDVGEELVATARAGLLTLLLAATVSTVTGTISSWSVRRGLAVVGSIGVLVVGSGVVNAVQGIATTEGAERAAQVAGLCSPYTLYAGLGQVLNAGTRPIVDPDGALMVTAYVVVPLLLAALGPLLVSHRFRRVARR